jgi:hypothetical protein
LGSHLATAHAKISPHYDPLLDGIIIHDQSSRQQCQ